VPCGRNLKTGTSEFCAPFQPVFYYGTIVCDIGVLSRVSWLVGPLKLRVAIQLTLTVVLEVIYQQGEVQMTSCEGCLFVYISERKLTSGKLCNFNRCK